MPLSVIMPVRDGGSFLERALTSTLRALPASSELLVMDDGSRDNTSDILASINDPRLKAFTRKSSLGVAHALNSLLENVRYPVVARMDADDICLPWRFLAQNRLLERRGGIVFGNVIYCNQSGMPTRPTLRLPLSTTRYRRKLLQKNPFVHPTMVAEMAAIERVGGYQIVGAEDYDLWLRLASLNVTFSVEPIPVLLYRQHSAQVTAGPEARDSVRKRWFAEESLVTSWAHLADKELGSSLMLDYLSGKAVSIDELQSSPTYLRATRGIL